MRRSRSASRPAAAADRPAPSPHFIQLDFAYATQTVLYVMGGIMAAAAIVAIIGLRPGVQAEEAPEVDA